MSWQNYINLCLATKEVASAAIFGFNGVQWAASPSFTVSPEEIGAIIAAKANLTGMAATGLRIAGKKYFYVRSEQNGTDSPSKVVGRQSGVMAYAVVSKQSIWVLVGCKEIPSFTKTEGIIDKVWEAGF